MHADPLAYPPALERAEAELIATRRTAAGRSAPERQADGRLPADTIGFGLSGGGVRSATFCLGVFQALAQSKVLARVDMLSTVSGGGYFGSFLGRLFTRAWIRGVDDVQSVLLGQDPPDGLPAHSGWGGQAVRWLRENGRYLAPRGSGDLIVLGSILLRNWVSLQIVLFITALTLLAAMQAVRVGLDRALVGTGAAAWMAGSWLRWSPWLILPAVPLTTIAIPAGWAYWLVARGPGRGAATAGTALAGLLALLGTAYYGIVAPTPDRHLRAAACLVVAGMAALTFGVYLATASGRSTGPALTAEESEDAARMRLSHLLARGLRVTGSMLVLGAIDAAGSAVYVVCSSGQLLSMAAGILAAFAAAGSLARPLALVLGWGRGPFRPRVPLSVLSWSAAVLVLAVWLTGVDVAAHALRWRLGAASFRGTPPTDAGVLLAASIVLAVFTVLLGRTRTFANLSSAQGFYSARLVRTFLGASNEARLASVDRPVWETAPGDDCHSRTYWQWPAASDPPMPPTTRAWDRGGPLHLINVTVNETVDARTGIQSQDRKGTGLAAGPCGLSLGIRHHLVMGRPFPDAPGGHRVFLPGADPPEALTLGRWASLSGAAYSTAAGANTSVPVAILCGMFNVRLGYWWDSGQPSKRTRWLERMLPVQTALFDEMFAHTRGTAGRLWNLSDGGHFENMGAYELIRRRVPLMVVVDAEADPDYTMHGLSGLIRKARLDFDAEIGFLAADALDLVLPPQVRPAFGDIDQLVQCPASDTSAPRTCGAHAALARVRYRNAPDEAAACWLVYVKATLTGDEPEDVRQYQRAHPEFPQETTFDQFFDEAQWESYRRLGQHVGAQVLDPDLFDRLLAGRQGSADV